MYNSRSLSQLYKAKTNKKESSLINEKKGNKLAIAQASKNSTVYHEASTFSADALMSKNNNSYQVAKLRLKWYKIVQVEKQCTLPSDSNDKW